MAANVNIEKNLIFKIVFHCLIFGFSSSVNELSIESGRVCSLDGNEKVLKLDSKDQSALVITQNYYFSTLSGRYDFTCTFTIKGKNRKEYGGIYAVIQNLSFRKNETTGECIDYIAFEENKNPIVGILGVLGFREDKRRTRRTLFCGKIFSSPEEDSSEEEYDLASNGFVLPEGNLHVTIYVAARKKLLPNEILNLKLVFTAYSKDCNRRASDSLMCNDRECIWAGFKKDGLQNCPYTTCRDEDGCRDLEEPYDVLHKYSSGTGTKVTVGAIIAILLTFFLFVACLWMAKNSKRFCWAVPNPNRNPRIEMSPTRVDTNVADYTNIPAPTAPPEPDVKDMPPSYDSLFPAPR